MDPILYSIELIQILSDLLTDIDTALDMQEIGSQTKTDLDKDLKDIEDSFVSIKSNLAKIVGSEA